MNDLIDFSVTFSLGYVFIFFVAWGSLECHLVLGNPDEVKLNAFIDSLKDPVRFFFGDFLHQYRHQATFAQGMQKRVVGSIIPIIMILAFSYYGVVNPTQPGTQTMSLVWIILFTSQYLLALRFGRKLLHL